MSLKRIIAAALMAATLSGAATAQNAGSYLAARQAGFDTDFAAAADYYTRALARDLNNPQLMEAATIAHLGLGAMARGLPIARQFADKGFEAQIPQMMLLAEDVQTGNWAAVLKRIDEKRGVGPLVDGLTKAWALIGQGEMGAALKAFDEVSTQRGLEPFAFYHKALALALAGDFEGAEAILSDERTQALMMTRRAVIVRAEVLSQLDKGPDALQLIDGAFGADLDPELKAFREKLANNGKQPFSLITDAKDGVAEVYFTVASALNSDAGDDYTLLYARIAEYLRPGHVEALLLVARLLDSLKQYDLSVETYRKVPASDPSIHAADLGRAEALRRAGKVEAAAEVLQSLVKSHGDLPVVHVTLGDLMRQLERYKEAAEAYTTALSIYGAPQPDHWFVYYARAISYERLSDWAKAEPDFRQALALNPDQPQVLNYLGYSLVEKQEKLDEALAMIERAVALRPDSGYIVDSLGWALYRLGRYDEAIGHMERAAELMPVDPVVNDHLGDVLWAVGRKREAEFQWRRALSFVDHEDASGDADPERIRRKLEVGLDQVLAEEGAPPLKVANGAANN